MRGFIVLLWLRNSTKVATGHEEVVEVEASLKNITKSGQEVESFLKTVEILRCFEKEGGEGTSFPAHLCDCLCPAGSKAEHKPLRRRPCITRTEQPVYQQLH